MENETNQPDPSSVQKDAAYYHNKALSLAAQGYSSEEIKNFLIGDGLNEESADFLAAEIMKRKSGSSSGNKEKGSKNMLYGALWCIGGIIITAISYNAAKGGGRYVITYGAIIVGAIQFFSGLAQYTRSDD